MPFLQGFCGTGRGFLNRRAQVRFLSGASLFMPKPAPSKRQRRPARNRTYVRLMIGSCPSCAGQPVGGWAIDLVPYVKVVCHAPAMPDSKRVRDPIHQFVERIAVNTPVFHPAPPQDRQLAMTHLVYPGTTHTRFAHSIGVRHVAWRLCHQLKLSANERRPGPARSIAP